MKTPKYTVDSPEVKERCGNNPALVPTSIICPHCGTPECFGDGDDLSNTNKWFWAIKAFKVDDYSHCLSCDTWF